MGTWSIEILQCGSGPPSNFLSKVLGVNTPLFLHHTVLLLVFFTFSLFHDQACIHMSLVAAHLSVFTPGAGCQVSSATVFFYFSFHPPPPIANHVCNGIVDGGHNAVNISHTCLS